MAPLSILLAAAGLGLAVSSIVKILDSYQLIDHLLLGAARFKKTSLAERKSSRPPCTRLEIGVAR